MKKSIRPIIILVAFALMLACLAVGVMAEGEPAGTVTEASTLLTAAKGKTDTDEKAEALYAVTKYMKEHSVDESEAGYAELISSFNEEKLAVAVQMLADAAQLSYDTEAAEGEPAGLPAAKKNTLVKRLRGFVERNPIDDTTEGYADFKTEYDAAVAELEAALADAKARTEAAVELDEYDKITHIRSDFDDHLQGLSIGGGGNTAQYRSELAQDPVTKNRYWSITYNGTTGSYSAYYPKQISEAVVFQFDIFVPEQIPNSGISLESTVIWARIESDGSLRLGMGNDKPVVEGVEVVLGQWTNIAIVVNLENSPFTYDLYVDYQQVVDDHEAAPWSGTFTPAFIRFGGGGNTSGCYYLDNIYIYQGTAIRTLGRLGSMTPDELYVYYADYATDTTKTAPTRKAAYERAAELKAANAITTSDPNVAAAVADLAAIDYDDLMQQVLEENLVGFEALLDKLTGIERRPETENERLTALSKVDTFISVHGSDLPTDTEEYKQLSQRLSEAREILEEDARIRLFNARMLRFTSAATLAAMKTHYEEAAEIYKEGISSEVLSLEGYEEYKGYYEIYISAEETLRTATMESNSKKIVDCVGFISKYTTEEQWVENYDKMERYILIIRETLASGLYDVSYQGLLAAIDVFTPMDEFFYARLQEDHIKFITEQLELYSTAETYIDQVGILATIIRYCDEADIDAENEELAQLLVDIDYCEAEVKVRGDDYAQVLRENAATFILLVDNLQIQNGYADTRAAFEEAAKYYYAIDKDYEGVTEAIAIYQSFESSFDAMDAASSNFLESVALLATATRADDIYLYLVDCCSFYSDINEEIEGVAEAAAEYREIYDAYYADYVSVNEEIEDANKAVVSCRLNCGVDAIVAIIYKKLFE